MDANVYDIERRIMKEAHDFHIKKYKNPDYVILDNETYDELVAYVTKVYGVKQIANKGQEVNDVDRFCDMIIVRTFTAGRGIAVGEDAR
ncbi:hypothetical protein SHANETTE_134 [Bacillus phage Shanette]|uniref:Uncharacterized protein n=2 Tax=Siminovitchvirus TaxID=1918721 RepID=S5MM86_9CAUD|nr:hypothetical protein AVV47_gp163 [Bacillus phage JL]YP_009216129.1 hypothetical protein AVV46_gp163 [Bacillus phage Shanette]AGR46805.1 hypothetical protein JL_133 [Bacillus phage JL]AGR47028.1 hypothetical protein SHANETTE_134 [Bacillus phage Shanette]